MVARLPFAYRTRVSSTQQTLHMIAALAATGDY